ncbi:uncharacterized protein [Nicotiana tomentosiformis]|uniref:uncharacterized protein n=1 Tax=Nicotiana tomentosiformis TaxID=4098 RepID=UPI00388C9466
MFTKGQTKKVNIVEDVQPMSNEEYEEANYVNNPQGGYQRQPYQGSGQQHQWRSNLQGQGNQQWRNDQGENEHVVEVEDSEQEVEAEVEVPIVVEVERLPKKVRTQEVNHEEVKEKQLSVNIPFVEAFQEMQGFAKYLKDLITKTKTTKNEGVNVNHRVSSIIATTVVQKKEDSGAFTIPCTIGLRDFARALCDNGAIINLIPLAIYKQAGLVGKFFLPADFVILNCAIDKEIPIILGRPFLATGRELMDSERNEINFRVNDEEVTFQASKGMKLPHAYESISVIDVVDDVDDAVEMKMEEECLGEALTAILVTFYGEDMEGYVESVNALEGLGSYTYAPNKLSLDLGNRVTPPGKPSIIEPQQLELKPLLLHLRYKFLGFNETLPVIVSSLLNDVKVEHLLNTLRDHRHAIGWTIADIRGIPAGICEHKIKLEQESKPSVEHQGRLEEAGSPKEDLEINDAFPDENLLAISSTSTPWYADIANFLASDLIPSILNVYQKKKFLRECRQYYWEEPFLFQICADNIIRRYFSEEEVIQILKACHDSPVGGHHSGNRTAAKVLECGYYWPLIYQDANQMVKACDQCQRQGSISRKHEMPMNFVMEVEIFDLWGIDFMGPFLSSYNMTYILVAVDYVSKWVEAIALPNNEARSVTFFLKKNIFTRFGTPRAILSDGGSHFCNKAFSGLLKKYGVKHKSEEEEAQLDLLPPVDLQAEARRKSGEDLRFRIPGSWTLYRDGLEKRKILEQKQLSLNGLKEHYPHVLENIKKRGWEFFTKVPGEYNETLVRKFYDAYATSRNSEQRETVDT